MANTYDLISTYTVGAGGIATVQFTGISNTYRDLLVIAVRRSSASSNNSYTTINNQNGTGNYTYQWQYGYMATPLSNASFEGVNAGSWLDNVNKSAAGSFFQPIRYYFPNANGSQIKTVIYEAGQEWNSTDTYGGFGFGTNTGITAAISSIEFRSDSGTWVQNSVFSLYGIKNS